ncbi:MAG: sensor histidine kinase [Bacillota bacterium]|nr:sensor histidine kinase [Bacillota bacterium]
MDIRWKNKYFNIIVLIIAIYMAALSILTASDIISHRKYLSNSAYFNSEQFKRELNEYYYSMLRPLLVTYKDYDKREDITKVTINEVNAASAQYQQLITSRLAELDTQYNQLIYQAQASNDKLKADSLTEEKNKKIDEAKKYYGKTPEEVRQLLLGYFTKDYENIKKAVDNRKSIKYYIKNEKTGEIYTNLNNVTNINSYIKKNALYSLKFPDDSKGDGSLAGITSLSISDSFNGYLIIPKSVEGYSQTHENYNYYNSIKTRVIKEVILLVVSIIACVTILLYLKKTNRLSYNFVSKPLFILRKIPIELRLGSFILSVLLAAYFINNTTNFFYFPIGLRHFVILTQLTAIFIYILICAWDFYLLIKKKEELKQQWYKSIIYSFKIIFSGTTAYKLILLKVLIFIIINFIFGGIMMLMLEHDIPTGFILSIISYVLTVLPYIIRKITLFSDILRGTDEIVSGNLDYVIDTKQKGYLGKLTNNINNMKQGFKKSLEGQIRSERLKSELITNVSHDLKTPLTSIINYVDLLKREELSKEEMQDYVEILARKTERLKVLIEDLFEASKLSSGEVELNLEKIDVGALLNQSLAEFEEKIIGSTLTFKVDAPKQKIYANLDGKKTWRVFENLINNTLKYSQPNTRVYIDLSQNENKIILTVKNISAYELDFDVDEIFERFKRGDKSRNTEGSGLGLAIAKSIVELQGGKLNIIIDGDLFKAIVEFNA